MGAGGMGEVWKARDTTLGRDVALKILPDHLALDPDRLARFKREAQILASLNHPNIAQIYGLEGRDGRESGTLALVLELVEGPTLADRIARGPIPLDEALPVAKQIAEALEAAHEQGIIHRDLKPSNIKLRLDGVVKVLDFGLAKALELEPLAVDVSQSPTVMSPAMTGMGVILGTAAYMSPEQARGRTVDKRTDIWAFGCVLYEMLTGRAAFGRDTIADTMAAILERAPDWQALPPMAMPSLRRVIQRCLEKDPKRRLRDVADVRFAIEDGIVDGHRAPEDSTVVPGGSPDDRALHTPAAKLVARTWRRWTWPAAIVLAVGAAWALGASTWLVGPSAVENPLAGARFTRLTDFEGAELDAAISPDGRFVAFVSDKDGQFDVWLSQIGSGVFRNLTEGRDTELPAPVRAPGFSSDGSLIWLGGGQGRRLQLIPLMGGAPRAFLSDRVVNISWSADGSRLAYHTRDAGDPLFVANRDGSDAQQIFVGANAGEHNHFPVWSADGRWIYFAGGSPATREMDLWRMAPSPDATPERLTHHNSEVAYPALIDDRTLVYVARSGDGSGPWLWVLDVESGTTRRVSLGVEKYTSVSASADGTRLVATVANPSANLWTVPILDRLADEREVAAFSVPNVNVTAPHFAGTSLFYLSPGGSGNSLWHYQNGQAVEIWRGDDALFDAPAVSPDGSRVAMALRRNGKLRMHLLSADGAELDPLTEAIDVRGTASFSPDSEWIVTGGSDIDGEGLFKIPLDGGAPVRLVAGQALNPVWSPDGGLIVYSGANVGSHAPLLAVTAEGTTFDLPALQVRREGGGSRARFLPDGKSLIYMQGFALSQDFWLLDLTTKATRQLTRLNPQGAMWSFDISPDGGRIVFDRARENSDIVLIDLKPSVPTN
ncbi:MAG TPA: protein kinase [Vicinamibacterales bacterium]|nr:protein kinase [Vicinamibacterales bacterium]